MTRERAVIGHAM